MKTLLRKLLGRGDRLRLPEMVDARGARFPEYLHEAAAHDLARAVRRCEKCNAKALCDLYLAAGNADAYRGFCPNGPYVEALRARMGK